LNAQSKKFSDVMDWQSYYGFREKFVMVHHADSLTVFGAQGSTYDEVFVDATDMMTAHENVRRMAYVSISRARNKVHIFMGDSRDYKAFKPEVDDIDF
jgi:ATP-dependent exoDNAse (exonuclease V) alpha subunit